jgi:hypothetical protein
LSNIYMKIGMKDVPLLQWIMPPRMVISPLSNIYMKIGMKDVLLLPHLVVFLKLSNIDTKIGLKDLPMSRLDMPHVVLAFSS